MEVKGGFAWAVWTTVVITSNIHPSGWYQGVNLAPLERRINEIRLLEHQGSYKKVDFSEHELDLDYVQFEEPTQIIPATPVQSPQLGLVDE